MTDSQPENQRALLLFHLFVAKDWKLTRGAANKKNVLTPSQRQALNLTTGAANQVRTELAHVGYIQKSKGRGTDIFQLTDKGLAYLVGLRHAESIKLTMTGKDMNALLAACSGIHREREPAVPLAPVPTLPAPAPVSNAEVEAAILSTFQELLRERFGHTGMVPIYEVRRIIAAKLGAQAGRHETFDPAVQRLRQEKKLEMVPISGLFNATRDQLDDSIPGVKETLFYLEPLHEQVLL